MGGTEVTGSFSSRLHQQVGAALGSVAVSLVALLLSSLGPQPDRFDAGDGWACAITGAIGLVVIRVLGRRFDLAEPRALPATAIGRMVGPILVLAVSVLFVRQLFYEHNFVGWPLALVVLTIFSAVVTLLPLFDTRLSTHIDQPAVSLPGPPVPAAQMPAAQNPWNSGAPALVLIHRLISGSIVLAWAPVGAAVLFAMNWCPPEGEDRKKFVLSVVFLTAQVIGNAAAGWKLDRYYGSTDGFFVCLARSLIAAVVVLLIALVTIEIADFVIGPHGEPNSCGWN